MEFETLTVHHYADDPAEDKRITLAPSSINCVAADVDDITLNGRSLRRVALLFAEGESLEVVVNHADLQLLERAVGSFFMG